MSSRRCFVLAGLVLLLPPIAGLPLPGFVAIALLMVGVVIAMPSIVRLALRHAPFARAIPYQIAIAQIAGTARYATLSVSAILVSFSLMVSMAIMVTSFRTSLDQWTQRVLPADVYVRLGYVGQSAHLDAQHRAAAGSSARRRALRDWPLRARAARARQPPLTSDRAQRRPHADCRRAVDD